MRRALVAAFVGVLAAVPALAQQPPPAPRGGLVPKLELKNPAEGDKKPEEPAGKAPEPAGDKGADKPGDKGADKPAEPTPESLIPKIGAVIARIQFKGQRKVEADAMKVVLQTREKGPYSLERVREDVRQLWRMGFFEDVQVDAVQTAKGVVVTYIVREKPAIRKIQVDGNDEIGLDKINEVIDIRREQILDLAKVKACVEKIHDVYVDKGFYLAEVSYEIKNVVYAGKGGESKTSEDNHVDVVFKVIERSKVEIRQIRFIGNKAVTEEELRSAMQTQEGGFFSFMTSSGTYKEDAFQRDLLLLTSFYYDRGFIQVKLSKPEIALSTDKRYMYIQIAVDEGPQFSIRSLDVKGDLLEPREAYLKRLGVKPGEVFNRSKLGQDIQHLNDGYKDQGYAYVNVTPNTAIDGKKRLIDVTFDIQKGQLVYFERIIIRGNSRTRDKVVRREMKVYEGELYNQTLLDISKRRITALGFFDRVDISTKRGSADDRIDVNVEVNERPTGTFQIGAGFSSVENFIAQAQISQNNLFGRGQTLSLQAQLSSLRQLFSLTFVEPYFLDTFWTFSFGLYDQAIAYVNYNRDATGGTLTWGYQLAPVAQWLEDTRLFLTYKLETVSASTRGSRVLLSGAQSSVVGSNVLAGVQISGITSSMALTLNYDTRDNRLFPTKGWFHQIRFETADPVFGSHNVYGRTDLTNRFYRPIWGPFVFKVNVSTGLVLAREHCDKNDRECLEGVPLFERYTIGGINDVRGFRFRSLGPLVLVPLSADPNSQLAPFTIGGNLQMYANAEIEFPIFEKVGIKGVVFNDFGNAWNTEGRYCQKSLIGLPDDQNPCSSFNPLDMRASWGFGFRWFSPIGPLRFEWGLPYSPKYGEDPIVFEFTIGNFF